MTHTPETLATLHSAAFPTERGWTAEEFADLLASPYVSLHHHPNGFALTRTAARESELLALAVDPARVRQGIGRILMQEWLFGLKNTAETAFLEVASDNVPASALYAKFGFVQTGLRKGYYARPSGPAADAKLMRRTIRP